MSFSIAFKVPINSASFETFIPNADPVSAAIAQSTASAAWAIVAPSWITAIVAAFALIAAVVSGLISFRALRTWRSQVTGEHEFGRILDAIAAVHEIAKAIQDFHALKHDRRSPHSDRISQKFRQELKQSLEKLSNVTAGLGVIWGKEFINLKIDLETILLKIDYACANVYEKHSSDAETEWLAPMVSPTVMIDGQQRDFTAKHHEFRKEIEIGIDSIHSFLALRLKRYLHP
jgi:hypothetical protein